MKKWYFWATHSRLEPMIKAAKTIKRHWDGVLRWFESRINDDEAADTTEEDLIDDLVERLTAHGAGQTKPLLVIQPNDLFNSGELFQRVLATPRLKTRQVIWRTASPNVPTALDAEKLIVTAVRRRRSRRWVEIVCAGDLHEDEIRREFINHFEGGWPGFLRRTALYTA